MRGLWVALGILTLVVIQMKVLPSLSLGGIRPDLFLLLVCFSSIWGDGTGSTVNVPGVGAGMSATKEKTHTIFGSLPNSVANQDAPVGNYTDTITVTVEY